MWLLNQVLSLPQAAVYLQPSDSSRKGDPHEVRIHQEAWGLQLAMALPTLLLKTIDDACALPSSGKQRKAGNTCLSSAV